MKNENNTDVIFIKNPDKNNVIMGKSCTNQPCNNPCNNGEKSNQQANTTAKKS